MKTIRFLVAAVITALAFTFFGCSGDDGGGDSQERYACQLPSGGGCIQATISDCSAAGGNTVETCAAGGNGGNPPIGGVERDSRLVLEDGYAWVDGYPAGERDGFIFKADGTYHGIGDSSGPWEIDVTGTWLTSGNNVLSVVSGSETYSFPYTVTNSTLIFTGSDGSYVLTKTAVTIGGQVTPPDVGTDPDVGTGTQESRRYRVEVYNLNSATYTYGGTTYGNKTYQDVVRADFISKGATVIAPSPYTNQTFSGVASILSTAATSIGYSDTAGLTNDLTTSLQTNNRSGHWQAFTPSVSSGPYRFFYVTQE